MYDSLRGLGESTYNEFRRGLPKAFYKGVSDVVGPYLRQGLGYTIRSAADNFPAFLAQLAGGERPGIYSNPVAQDSLDQVFSNNQFSNKNSRQRYKSLPAPGPKSKSGFKSQLSNNMYAKRRRASSRRYSKRRVYRKKMPTVRNTYGVQRSVRIPRPLKYTNMPRRLETVLHHWGNPTTGVGLSYPGTGNTPTVSALSIPWMDCGTPLPGTFGIPQSFSNLSKIYKKYLICWVKLSVTYIPLIDNVNAASCEQVLFVSNDVPDASADFTRLMTQRFRNYQLTPPQTRGDVPIKYKKQSLFLRPNQLLGVDWRMYAGDEKNWGTLGDSTTPGGAPPTNSFNAQLWSRSVSSANISPAIGADVKYHWSAKVQVWDTDPDWNFGNEINPPVESLVAPGDPPAEEKIAVVEDPFAEPAGPDDNI